MDNDKNEWEIKMKQFLNQRDEQKIIKFSEEQMILQREESEKQKTLARILQFLEQEFYAFHLNTTDESVYRCFEKLFQWLEQDEWVVVVAHARLEKFGGASTDWVDVGDARRKLEQYQAASKAYGAAQIVLMNHEQLSEENWRMICKKRADIYLDQGRDIDAEATLEMAKIEINHEKSGPILSTSFVSHAYSQKRIRRAYEIKDNLKKKMHQ